MLPDYLLSSYKQYKADSDTITTWIACNAKLCGCPSDLLDGDKVKVPKAKGRARKLAREALLRKLPSNTNSKPTSSVTLKKPKYLIPIKNFIPLAKVIAKSTKPRVDIPPSFFFILSRAIAVRKEHGTWHQQKQKDDIQKAGVQEKDTESSEDGHSYFIEVLQQVRSILYPRLVSSARIATSPELAETTSRINETIGNQTRNGFKNLVIEEPSDELLDFHSTSINSQVPASDASVVTYGAKISLDFHEAYFAYLCLLHDIRKIRLYLEGTWEKYKQGESDLMTISIITNTGIEFSRRFHNEFVEAFPKHSNESGLLELVYSHLCRSLGQDSNYREFPSDLINFEAYDAAERIMLPTRVMVNTLLGARDFAALVNELGSSKTYDPMTDHKEKSARDKFAEDLGLVQNAIMDMDNLVRHWEVIPAEDELLQGVRQLCTGDPISISTVFAIQVSLDVHHVLQDRVSSGFQILDASTRVIEVSIQNVLSQLKKVSSTSWLKEHEDFLRGILHRIEEWVKTDQLQIIRGEILERIGLPVPPVAPFRFLKWHPVYCGLLLYSIKWMFHEGSLLFANIWRVVHNCAHLYNALRQEGLVQQP
ncbi:MAG: hypothetical protein M1814_000682 [Vezdaea aestivalis]|nr:MAG: hypothetical protein M1814_000682 [Vezdaea aestivalis]